MKIELLGPLTVRKENQPVAVGGPLHQVVVAILVSEPRPVSTESLINLLWPVHDPDTVMPKAPRDRLYEIVADIRRALRDAGLDAGRLLPQQRNGCYWTPVTPEQVDLLRFQDRCDTARKALAANDHDKAVRLFREAFAEWGAETGPPAAEPFAGLTGSWVRGQRDHLRKEYLAALAACIEAELRLGRDDRLVPELVSLVTAYPLDERFVGQLMLAYHRSGQTAEALRALADVRHRLAEELGTEPAERLQDLQRRILRQDPALHEASESTSDTSTSQTPEGEIMNEYYTNNIDGLHIGPSMVTSKMYGDVHFGAREDEGVEGSALTDHCRRFRRAVRTARQEGDLSPDAAAVVDAELAQALSHLVEPESVDGFVSAMEGVRRLVDGAPDLVSRADAMIDAARRGAR